jgi:uncharacterized Zn-finger protein
LTVHSQIHTGEKPYVCDHEGCQKAFSDVSLDKDVRSGTSSINHSPPVSPAIEEPTRESDRMFAKIRPADEGKTALETYHPEMSTNSHCRVSYCSFCRKATLTKHQDRFHPPRSLTQPALEDPEAPVAVSIPNAQERTPLA